MKTPSSIGHVIATGVEDLLKDSDLAVEVIPLGIGEARRHFRVFVEQARDGCVFVIRHGTRKDEERVLLMSEGTLVRIAESPQPPRMLGDVIRSWPSWGRAIKRVEAESPDDYEEEAHLPSLQKSGAM